MAAYDGLMIAKKKEVQSLTNIIEDKFQRVGDLRVEIQNMKNGLGDTVDGVADDKRLFAGLDNNSA